jgi:hypothetical protein
MQNAISYGHIRARNAHEACCKASKIYASTKKWSDHCNKVFAITYILEDGEEDCCEKCGESSPFGDSQIAKDLRVVYARWDNHKQQFVPVCMCADHIFEDPPLLLYTWEVAGTCFFVAIALIIVLAIFSPTMYNNDDDDHYYSHYYNHHNQQRSDGDNSQQLAIILIGVGLFVGLLVCIFWSMKKKEPGPTICCC